MFIKVVIILFSFYAVYKVYIKYKSGQISAPRAIFWLLLWVAVIGAALWPKTTDLIAKYVGVGRGADLLVYLSILVIFFLMFRIIIRLEKIDREITKIVRKVALDEKSDNK